MTRVKICCISSVQEMKMAVSYGANAVGLVARMPSGPGPIEDETIFHIAEKVPPGVSSFLLTCETKADAIIAHHKRTLTNTIQIVDAVEQGVYAKLNEAIPAVKIVQVIHVINEKSVDEASAASEWADAILLDSGNPNLAVKELGGTGRVHNWDLSRRIVEECGLPVFLAGGLNPDNVKKAIDTVNPYGVDICSGVRTDGRLDESKLEKFFKQVLG